MIASSPFRGVRANPVPPSRNAREIRGFRHPDRQGLVATPALGAGCFAWSACGGLAVPGLIVRPRDASTEQAGIVPDTIPLRIDFVSDVSCPWCAVGLKALEQAIARVGDEVAVELHFQPFELNPQIPPEGHDTDEHLMRKYGSTPAQLAQNREALRQRGASVGFEFRARLSLANGGPEHPDERQSGRGKRGFAFPARGGYLARAVFARVTVPCGPML